MYIDLDARKPDFSISEDKFLVMVSMAFRLNLFRLKDIPSKNISPNTTFCLKFVEKCPNSSKNVYFFRLNFVYTYNGKERQVIYEG